MISETKSQDIKLKMRFKGKVIKTTLAGAIVDIGIGKLGIVHIAHIGSGPIKRVEDVLKVGQEIDVWVRRIKKDAKVIELTMIEPLALEWRDIKKGMVVRGKVVRLEKFGAFIDIGAERPGLSHISELTHEYIRKPEDAVNIGDEVDVKIIDYDKRKKQIKLSLKALKEVSQPEPELTNDEIDKIEEPVLTAMEVAYRDAINKNHQPTIINKVSKSKPISKASTQDDIISRTLSHKKRTK